MIGTVNQRMNGDTNISGQAECGARVSTYLSEKLRLPS